MKSRLVACGEERIIVSLDVITKFGIGVKKQQAETQIKRRMGIGARLSERRLIEDLARMGMNDSMLPKLTSLLFNFQ